MKWIMYIVLPLFLIGCATNQPDISSDLNSTLSAIKEQPKTNNQRYVGQWAYARIDRLSRVPGTVLLQGPWSQSLEEACRATGPHTMLDDQDYQGSNRVGYMCPGINSSVIYLVKATGKECNNGNTRRLCRDTQCNHYDCQECKNGRWEYGRNCPRLIVK